MLKVRTLASESYGQETRAEEESLKASSTHSEEAYNLLLRGRAYVADNFINSQPESLQNAERVGQRASERDPTFVDAYSLLVKAYTLEATNFQENGARNIDLAEQAARKAVSLNPQSFEANMALGAVYAEQGKNADSIRLLREAVTLARRCGLGGMAAHAIYHVGGDRWIVVRVASDADFAQFCFDPESRLSSACGILAS